MILLKFNLIKMKIEFFIVTNKQIFLFLILSHRDNKQQMRGDEKIKNKFYFCSALLPSSTYIIIAIHTASAEIQTRNKIRERTQITTS